MQLAFDCCEASAGLKKNLHPILLLHGMIFSKETWTQLAPLMANATGRKVYWMDARNHGDSPRSDDFNFDFMAQDVVNFMVEHKISKAVLLGSAMGGKTAMKLALEKPDLVEKLVVLDIVPKPFPITGWKIVVAVMLMMEEALGAIKTSQDEAATKSAIMEYLMKKMPDCAPRKNQDLIAKVLPLEKAGATYRWKTDLIALEKILILNEIDDTITGSFAGETLFLYGKDSYMKVGEDATIIELFPKAKLVAIEGATHMVNFEEPNTFLEEVTKFINEEC